MQVCGSNGSTAILATKRSAGVTLEVNKESIARKWWSMLKADFETQTRHH